MVTANFYIFDLGGDDIVLGVVLADWSTSSLIFIVCIHRATSLPTAHDQSKFYIFIEVESTSLCILKVFSNHMSSPSVYKLLEDSSYELSTINCFAQCTKLG